MLNRYFCKNAEEIFILRKFYSQISNFILKELLHTLLIEPIGLQEGAFPKFASCELIVACYTILFYP